MSQEKKQPERRTLRDYGFTGCTHDDGSVAFDQGQHHCPYCGAKRVGNMFLDGSIDYKIDFAVLSLRKKDPKSCFYEPENLASE
jgi:hypothetical protein